MVRIRTISLSALLAACHASAPPPRPVAATVPPTVHTRPVEAPPAPHYVSIAAGDEFGCALRSDGAVWCWGSDSRGALGDGEPYEDRAEPRAVSSITDAVELALSNQLACAVTRGGALWCWGGWSLGDQRDEGRSAAPVRLVDRDVAHIALSRFNLFALRVDGEVVRWSRDRGRPFGEIAARPFEIAPATQLAVDDTSVCVVSRAGPVECVQHRSNGVSIARQRFEYAPGAVRSIVGGGERYFARREGGAVDGLSLAVPGEETAETSHIEHVGALAQGLGGWLADIDGRVVPHLEGALTMGNGLSTRSEALARTPVIGIRSPRSLAVGENFACALLDDDALRCWGANAHQQLAERDVVERSFPEGAPTFRGARDLVASDHRVCAIMPDGPARCWGDSGSATAFFGDGLYGSATPRPRVALGAAATLAGMARVACAVSPDGALTCARAPYVDESFEGAYLDESMPHEQIDHVALASPASSVAVAARVVCASLRDGSVACSAASARELGDAPIALSTVAGISHATRVLSFSDIFGDALCALIEGAPPRCWGRDTEWGLIARSTQTTFASPVARDDLGDVVSLAAGANHACVVERGGAVKCWGRGRAGQLGVANFSERASPTEVPAARGALEVAVGNTHSCARMQNGTVRCWGDNSVGQLGDGLAPRAHSEPAEVPGLERVTRIVAAYDDTCALRDDGTVWCWGGYLDRVCGDGLNYVVHPRPTAVLSE